MNSKEIEEERSFRLFCRAINTPGVEKLDRYIISKLMAKYDPKRLPPKAYEEDAERHMNSLCPVHSGTCVVTGFAD